MGVSKAILFSEKQNKLATIAKALGHPARIAIIQHLFENKTCIVSKLIEELPLSQSTISQHLKELKNVGLIKGEIEGQKVCYCLNREMMLEISGILSQYVDDIKKCC